MSLNNYLISIFLFRLDNAEVYVLSGQDNRYLCGTVHISLCINDVCDINCHGALGDQVEITVKRYIVLHVKEVEVYMLVGELENITCNCLHQNSCYLNKFVSLYIAPDTGRALYMTVLTHPYIHICRAANPCPALGG